jgi:hypothetical protein
MNCDAYPYAVAGAAFRMFWHRPTPTRTVWDRLRSRSLISRILCGPCLYTGRPRAQRMIGLGYSLYVRVWGNIPTIVQGTFVWGNSGREWTPSFTPFIHATCTRSVRATTESSIYVREAYGSSVLYQLRSRRGGTILTAFCRAGCCLMKRSSSPSSLLSLSAST